MLGWGPKTRSDELGALRSILSVLVMGGAGFIGSALVRALIAADECVVTVDKLTYAGNLDNVAPIAWVVIVTIGARPGIGIELSKKVALIIQ